MLPRLHGQRPEGRGNIPRNLEAPPRGLKSKTGVFRTKQKAGTLPGHFPGGRDERRGISGRRPRLTAILRLGFAERLRYTTFARRGVVSMATKTFTLTLTDDVAGATRPCFSP